MDLDNNAENLDINFGKEIGKTLVLSTASTAGAVTGIVLISFLYGLITKFKERRETKKNQKLEKKN